MTRIIPGHPSLPTIMPTEASSAPQTQALPGMPAPKKTSNLTDVQSKQAHTPTKSFHRKPELLFSPSIPHAATPSMQLQPQPTTDSDYSIVPHIVEDEDEYTLSAYGDISLGEVIVPPLPVPTRPPGPLQPRVPQPRLRLKVRRPPMPKRRPSYIYVPDPLPHSGGMESDERWPGSPRPIANSPSWLQHQPLVSPLPVDSTNSRARENKPVKMGAPGLEHLVNELLPRSPSIRLSPPGSPASQVLSLPPETKGQKSGVRQGRNVLKANDAAMDAPQSLPAPAPQQDKPWRTRLPPRPPIPKWDI